MDELADAVAAVATVANPKPAATTAVQASLLRRCDVNIWTPWFCGWFRIRSG